MIGKMAAVRTPLKSVIQIGINLALDGPWPGKGSRGALWQTTLGGKAIAKYGPDVVQRLRLHAAPLPRRVIVIESADAIVSDDDDSDSSSDED